MIGNLKTPPCLLTGRSQAACSWSSIIPYISSCIHCSVTICREHDHHDELVIFSKHHDYISEIVCT